uniref:Succinate--CoA ligase [ADP-forming] subunit alpha n=1 Tax=candidate division WOR-3 bacterium TaxID=2052148 RepID=A0A7C3YQD0_UNCW3
MGILISKRSRVLVQGITGRDGSFHTREMVRYGTNVVGGVSPKKGGSFFDKIPVFRTVEEAKRKTGCDTSIIFVPAPFAADAIYEACDAGLDLVVVITEGIPVLEMMKIKAYLKKEKKRTKILGPNCPGVCNPGEAKVGIIPSAFFKKGKVGVVSRSGTLTYEISYHISQSGYGISTVVGIGGDAIKGIGFSDCLSLFQEDSETEAIVIIGEIGGDDEEIAAKYVAKKITKPVFGFIAGKTAPPEKRMGHAGAIIMDGKGTAEEKIRAFHLAGITLFSEPEEIKTLLQEKLG